VTVASVIGDLPPGTRRNTYLPPEPTKGGYSYETPKVPFPTRPTPSFPGPRPTPSFPGPRPTPTYPGPRPTPSYPGPRPTPSYPGPRPTPSFPGPRPTPTYPTKTPGTFPTPSTGYPRPRPTPPFTSDFNGQQIDGITGPGVSIYCCSLSKQKICI